MRIDDQITFADIDDEYKTFVEKFKPKKTTDDCYTPQNVYDAVLSWVIKEYGVDENNIVRPFWPGGDYEHMDYPEDCTVVDNPPFSIISQICRVYQAAGIKFFLFAPYLTNFGSQAVGLCHVVTDANITYENGANINTSFLTNLDNEFEIRTAPDLAQAIFDANKANKKTATLPKYVYPPNVLTACMVGKYGKYGIDFRVKFGECRFIRTLESQKNEGKTIFGSGYLISDKAAAEKAAAEKAAAEKAAAEKAAAVKAIEWPLSEIEKLVINELNKRSE